MKLEYLFRKSILEDFIGMPNIVAGRSICPELLADQASPEGIAESAVSLLADPAALNQMREVLCKSRSILGAPGATRSAAQVVLQAACQRSAV
jgi:lipid-A-disaccharide synthase